MGGLNIFFYLSLIKIIDISQGTPLETISVSFIFDKIIYEFTSWIQIVYNKCD